MLNLRRLYTKYIRAVSSAGERFVDFEEATGSIPVQPINLPLYNYLYVQGFCFF